MGRQYVVKTDLGGKIYLNSVVPENFLEKYKKNTGSIKNKEYYRIEAVTIKQPCKLFGFSRGEAKIKKFKKVITKKEYQKKSLDYFRKMALNKDIFKEVWEKNQQEVDKYDEIKINIKKINKKGDLKWI